MLEGAAPSLNQGISQYLINRWYLAPLRLLPVKVILKHNYNLAEALMNFIDKPIVIFQGEGDKITPIDKLIFIAEHMKNVDLRVVKNARHHNTYLQVLPEIVKTADMMVMAQCWNLNYRSSY